MKPKDRDFRDIAVGATFECAYCGETLAKTTEREEDVVEVATYQEHQCWQSLPEGAEHLRIDE